MTTASGIDWFYTNNRYGRRIQIQCKAMKCEARFTPLKSSLVFGAPWSASTKQK
jgi:hypothetical protein